MDALPSINQLVIPPFTPDKFREVESGELEKDKYYYFERKFGRSNSEQGVRLVQDERPRTFTYSYVYRQRNRGDTPGWEKGPGGRITDDIRPTESFQVPMTPAKAILPATEEKAKVQAVKDVLANKGLPDTMDSGPLGNILGMAGIKAPPKRTGLGRRKTNRRTKKRKTRRS